MNVLQRTLKGLNVGNAACVEKSGNDAFVLLFQAHPIPLWIYDLETLRFVAVNTAAIQQYGYSEAEFLERTILDIRPEEDVPRLQSNLASAPASGLEKAGVWRHRRKDGSLIDVEISSHVLEFGGRACKFVMALDVTARLRAEEKLAGLGRINAVLSGINSAIVRLRDRQQLFEEACRIAVELGQFRLAWVGRLDPATQRIHATAWSGLRPSGGEHVELTVQPGLPGSDWPVAVALREMRTVVCNDIETEPAVAPLREAILEQGHRSLVAFPLIVDHRPVGGFVLTAASANFFDDAELKLLSELAADISFALEYIEREERLSYVAYYDTLTGLPNRTLFHDRLAQYVQAARHEKAPLSVVLIDILRFKRLNDSLGRHVGDALLQAVARRLGNTLRGGACSLARIGADVFAFACLEITPDAEIALAEQVLQSLAQPFKIDVRELRIAASVGIALFPSDGDDADILFRNAEAALKQAKAQGDRYLYYSPQINAQVAHKLDLEERLRRAIEARQFVLHFQPRIDLITGQIVAAEALVRWRHPSDALVHPAEFIPVAEESGLIAEIGDWVLDTVCSQQAAWQAEQVPIVPVAVNLSAVQLRRTAVLDAAKRALARHRLNPAYLEVELTESTVMENTDTAAQVLRAFRELGLRLSLDDFGTGYSSLAYLKRFSFNFVKIDRSFIADITTNPEDAAIATAIIAMAHSLNLRVVAVGVETEAQVAFLRARGCDEIQGFHFSPAVPAGEFGAMLRSKRRLESSLHSQDQDRTILLVDDEPNILSSLTRLLRRDGYRILTATSGSEGLDQLAINKVQVIVSDQRMPHMSGTEFLSIAKQLYPDTLRIILSGFTDLAVVTESVNRGAVYKFLTKPWDDELLREHIRDAFARYRPLQ